MIMSDPSQPEPLPVDRFCQQKKQSLDMEKQTSRSKIVLEKNIKRHLT
jgi:hypothetical protein